VSRYDAVLASPPAGLSDEVAALWPGHASDLFVRTGATAVELDRLADVLRLEDRLRAVRRTIDEQGLTVAGSQGQTRPHPLIDVEIRLVKAVADGYRGLHLTPGPDDALKPVGADGRLVHA
jgi:hypothetical protein